MSDTSYRNLVVWQKAMDLVVAIYQLCKQLPTDERYGITSQMKRAAVSIPSNIAEGSRRNHNPEQRQFFTIAYGSGSELETQLELCVRLGLVNQDTAKRVKVILDEVMRMLNALLASRR